MNQTYTLTCDGQAYAIPADLSLDQALKLLPSRPRHPLGALVNGKFQELDYIPTADVDVTWLDYNCGAGWRIYRSSMVYLLLLAVERLYPQARLFVSHSLSEGLFCRLKNGPVIDAAVVRELSREMEKYIREDIPIRRRSLSREQAAQLFRSQGEADKAALLERGVSDSVSVYQANDRQEYFFSPMATRGGQLGYFDLIPYGGGFVLHLPTREYLGCRPFDVVMVKQLQATMEDYDRWSDLMGVSTVEDLNRIIRSGDQDFLDLIQVSETLYENRLHDITEAILRDFPTVRLLLLAGPSSSGKTTTTMRLAVHFRTQGIRPVYISMDDYFLDRERTPKKPNGEYDFECVGAMDMELFHDNMRTLLSGGEASLPRFDFKAGRSIHDFRKVSLGDDRILIVEGIHALNDLVSADIPAAQIRKLFVSALTQINYDDYSPVPASDARMVRRMARDMQFRGIDPEGTLARWDDVRRGEHQNIFPFQESADFFINSAMLYETPVLRPFVEPALAAIDPSSPSWEEAQRILTFLRCYEPAPPTLVPQNSILREFIGGSVFDV